LPIHFGIILLLKLLGSEAMLIDWFTVFAQLINFLILVWLLKRFLYKPILDAIDKRETQIAKKNLDAEKFQLQSKEERDKLQHQRKEIDKQRDRLFGQSVEDAKVERERLFEEARKEVKVFNEKRFTELKREEKKNQKKLIEQTQKEVFTITRKVLLDLGSASLESQIVDAFIKRLDELDDKNKITLKAAFSSSDKKGVVRSTVELKKEQRRAIVNKINEYSSKKEQVLFEVVPELFSGIELIMNGQKLAWTIGDYLSSMEKDVLDLLNPEKSAP
jgi:F-type H+-transporting ATPase subunit b